MEIVLENLALPIDKLRALWALSAFVGGLFLSLSFLLSGLAYSMGSVLARGSVGYMEDNHGDERRLAPHAKWVQVYLIGLLWPLRLLFHRSKLPPNAINTLCAMMATAGGIVLATGNLTLGGWLSIFAGCISVARLHPLAAIRPAALDDRPHLSLEFVGLYAQMAILMGMGWHYRHTWVLFPILAGVMGLAMTRSLITYGPVEGGDDAPPVETGLSRSRGESALTANILGHYAFGLFLLGGMVAFLPIFSHLQTFAPGDSFSWYFISLGVTFYSLGKMIGPLNRWFYRQKSTGKLVFFSPRGMILNGLFGAKGGSTVLKNMIAGFVATFMDYMLVIFLVSKMGFAPAMATAAGCALGGATNFLLNRLWTFPKSSNASTVSQASRYLFVSISAALLNSGGVGVILLIKGLDYRLAWLMVRGVVYFLWNYPLHRDYVFSPPSPKETSL